MKVTSDDTRMLEIEFGVFVHVRGDAAIGWIPQEAMGICEVLDGFAGKRVLILEIVE